MPFDSPYMISYCNYVSIMHHFRDIITYFRKSKDVTWPWQCPFKGQFVIPMLTYHLMNQSTKFEVSSFSHSLDMIRGTKNWNRSDDHTHAPFGGDFSFFWLRFDIAHLWTQYGSSSFSHFWDMDGAPKYIMCHTDITMPPSGTVCSPYCWD